MGPTLETTDNQPHTAGAIVRPLPAADGIRPTEQRSQSKAWIAESDVLRRAMLPVLLLTTLFFLETAVVGLILFGSGLEQLRLQGNLWSLLWGIIVLGIIAAILSCMLAWRFGRHLQRSFDDVVTSVQTAESKLGQALSQTGQPSVPISEQLRRLVDGIDRVLEDRRQREREVMRSDQLAMVGQIAAGVAHELRNPLTSVKMLVQTNLKEASRRGLPADDLDIIEQEIRRMERCLQRFLDFARPPKPERRPLSLSTLVTQTFALVDGRAKRQDIDLKFTPPAVPVIAEADEDQIRQLLVNLVLNALDAMAEHGTIEVSLDKGDNGQIELRVADTGPGIPDELFPRLFDPFVSTKVTGIGLGLAVSYRIAAGHGGMLSAFNRPEGGACFLLQLPESQRTAPRTRNGFADRE